MGPARTPVKFVVIKNPKHKVSRLVCVWSLPGACFPPEKGVSVRVFRVVPVGGEIGFPSFFPATRHRRTNL